MDNAPGILGTPPSQAMRDSLLEALIPMMRRDPSIVLLVGEFGSPVLDRIRAEYPRQFLNVGIAEQNLINLATGMALEGCKVLTYAIAPFITMRCYEQIRVNLGMLSQIRPVNVTIVGVGAGCSYAMSGPTHQCFEDLTIMRILPNVGLFSPADAATTTALLPGFLSTTSPRYLRLDAAPLPDLSTVSLDEDTLRQGFRILEKGNTNICVVSTGFMSHVALNANSLLKKRTGHTVTIVDLFRLKPSPAVEELVPLLRSHRHIVTIEEGFTNAGGMDSLIQNMLRKHKITASMSNLGMNDRYGFDLGPRSHLLSLHGADAQSLAEHLAHLTSSASPAGTGGERG